MGFYALTHGGDRVDPQRPRPAGDRPRAQVPRALRADRRRARVAGPVGRGGRLLLRPAATLPDGPLDRRSRCARSSASCRCSASRRSTRTSIDRAETREQARRASSLERRDSARPSGRAPANGRVLARRRRRRAACSGCFTRLFDEAEFLSPYGLRAVSRWHAEHPFELDVDGDGLDDRLRAGRVDDGHVRRQLELARADLDARQLPRRRARSRATRASSATTSRSSTRPARASELTLDEIADDLRERLISLFLVGADGRRPCFGWVERLQNDPAWKDNVALQRVLPRRQRRRPRRDPPDRLDGARRRPDPPRPRRRRCRRSAS